MRARSYSGENVGSKFQSRTKDKTLPGTIHSREAEVTYVYKIASQVALLCPACLHLLQSRITVGTLLGLIRFLLGLSDERGLGGGIKLAPALKSTVSMSGIGNIVPE